MATSGDFNLAIDKGTLRRRRQIMAGIAGAALVVGVGSQVAGADGGVTLTPDRGASGTAFRVEVTCGDQPAVYRKNLQDDPVQGTIGSFPSSDLNQTSPSVWTVDQVATGKADAEYYATCARANVGEARFDAEAPHLWFGPRPRITGIQDPKTMAEGTDCPAGTTAEVSITGDGQRTTTEATIDEYGDWSVPLPVPVGVVDLRVTASCGDVVYDPLTAPSTTTTRFGQAPEQTMPAPSGSATTPNAAPAVAAPASSNFTG